MDLEMAPPEFFQSKKDSNKQNSTKNKTKLPEIHDLSRNQEFHKESFQHLLNLYGRSTSHVPVKLFTEKTHMALHKVSSAGEPLSPPRLAGTLSKNASRRSSMVSSDNKREHRIKKSIAFQGTNSQGQEEQQHQKQEQEHETEVTTAKNDENQEALKKMIPDLIEAVLINAHEPIDKKAPNDVPRINAIDWSAMLKKGKALALYNRII